MADDPMLIELSRRVAGQQDQIDALLATTAALQVRVEQQDDHDRMVAGSLRNAATELARNNRDLATRVEALEERGGRAGGAASRERGGPDQDQGAQSGGQGKPAREPEQSKRVQPNGQSKPLNPAEQSNRPTEEPEKPRQRAHRWI